MNYTASYQSCHDGDRERDELRDAYRDATIADAASSALLDYVMDVQAVQEALNEDSWDDTELAIAIISGDAIAAMRHLNALVRDRLAARAKRDATESFDKGELQ